MNLAEEDEDNPGSIWSNLPDASTRSTAAASADIWATVPSSSSSGYHPQYISTPPKQPPIVGSSSGIDEFDPFSPTTTNSFPTQPTTTATTLLGTGIRKNSKLVLIDTDSEDGEEEGSTSENELELRKRLEREALELHERDKQARRMNENTNTGSGSGSGGFTFGNMFKTLSSVATSPSNSRPSTPNAASTSISSQLPSPLQQQPRPRPQTPTSASSVSKEEPAQSPLGKPFASIASVFRSSPSQPSSVPPPSSSSSLLSAIAGKGKAREEEQGQGQEGEITNEKHQRSTPTKRKTRRPDPTFDFTKFLEQMRTRQADPIAKYLRSFLKEFSRKPPQSTTDQTKVINDFLDFIAEKMRGTDPWKTIYAEEVRRGTQQPQEAEEITNEKGGGQVADEKELQGVERAEAEFELSLEAMEKLVMNRLWHLTFTPALDPTNFEGGMSPSGDLERDQVVRQRIRLFGWIEPKHLDLPISVDEPSNSIEGSSGEVTPENEKEETQPAKEKEDDETEKEKEREEPNEKRKEGGEIKSRKKGSERGFIDFAASELRKMNQYKAPRDKLICVLNCCKVIFGLIRHVASSVEDQGADTFIPFLIYVVLQANPEHLVSNLQYIQRFRNPEKLAGEGGYYLSSLNAAISFIETLDASALSNIDQSEFEHNVASAVKLLASEEPPPPPPPRSTRLVQQDLEASRPGMPSPQNSSSNLHSVATDETSSASLILPTSSSNQPLDHDPSTSPRNLLLRGSDSVERAMSKPIGALARIFEQIEITANEITGQSTPPPPLSSAPSASTSSTSTAISTSRGVGGRPPNPNRRSYLSSSTFQHPPSPLQMHSPPSPDPQLYAPESVSDAKISETIERQERESHEAKMNTLMELFSSSNPGGTSGERQEGGGVEREVVEMVLWAEQGDVGRAVERLLEMA